MHPAGSGDCLGDQRRGAPRPVLAFLPRSRAAATTGAASGVQMVAVSAFSLRTSTVLPEIFVRQLAASGW